MEKKRSMEWENDKECEKEWWKYERQEGMKRENL